MTTVANVKVNYIRKCGYDNLEEWCSDPTNVYIGRAGIVFIKKDNGSKERYPKVASVWANPFKVGKDGTLDEILAKYRSHITQKIKTEGLNLQELSGKNLGCWCVETCKTSNITPTVCHGQVLMDLLNADEPVEEEQGRVLFYEKGDPFYEFSNFYEAPVRIDDPVSVVFPTSEHAYQAFKFYDEDNPHSMEYFEIIANASTASKAFILANQKISSGYKWKTDLNPIVKKYLDLGVTIRSDWDEIKLDLMKIIVQEKFDQHPNLKRLLLSTGTREIVENSPSDSFWGIGKDGNGENWLGKILMEIRDSY